MIIVPGSKEAGRQKSLVIPNTLDAASACKVTRLLRDVTLSPFSFAVQLQQVAKAALIREHTRLPTII